MASSAPAPSALGVEAHDVGIAREPPCFELLRELRHHVEATGLRRRIESPRERGVYVVAGWSKPWSNGR